MRRKEIATPQFKLMLKHFRLIESARRRGYSARAIAKLVVAAEDSER